MNTPVRKIRAASDGLPNLNLEAVFMAPPEVLPPLGSPRPRKHHIPAMPLYQVLAVFTIFSVVPRMIVAAVPIVITPFTMVIVVSHHRYWGNEGGSQQQPAEN
jgi:hypothetical protein